MSLKRSEITGNTVAVDGMRDLMRALRQMDKATRKELRAKLKSVGQIVADEAKAIAGSKMTPRSGGLARGIRIRVNQRSVSVIAGSLKRSAAYPQGYNYPKRHEYEGRGGGSVGPRAFMHPALESKQEEVVKTFEEVLDELEKEWSS